MIPKLISVLFLGALAASPALGMQEKHATDKKPTQASRPVREVEFTLNVAGLQKENAAGVQGALGKFTVMAFVCPDCEAVMPAAGSCPACKTELEEHSQTAFQEVTPSADKGTIAFRLEPGVSVRLSQIEKALVGASVQVQRDRMDVGKGATLVYTGGKTAGDASALQQAFRDAKLADAVAMLDSTSKEIHVHALKPGTKWASAVTLGEDLETPLRLADVIWGKPMPIPVKG